MDTSAKPGDTLAQPTRARLFDLLCELRRPAGTEELAQRLGMHSNGVRVHLERMQAAGLVARERQRLPRGRPRDVWSVDPAAQPGGEPPRAYADLGRWLVRALAAGRVGTPEIEAAGREIGRELVAADDGSPERRFFSALSAMGFAPQRVGAGAGKSNGKKGNGNGNGADGGDGAIVYCLGNCPYRQAVAEHQTVVCGLHRGITRGMLDAVSPRSRLSSFVAKDPARAGCEIGVSGPLAGGAVAG